MENLISFFEIPVTDFERAQSFYSNVLQCEINEMDMMGAKMGFLPNDGSNVSGALVQDKEYEPSTKGTLVYLNAQNDIPGFLLRIKEAGGTVLVDKTEISPEFGFFALFLDSEGNKIALYSMK